MVETAAKPLLRVTGLKKYFPVRQGVFSHVTGHLRAVDGVSFDIAAGTTLGLVGESGSGKTTVGRTILRLIEPTAGRAFYENVDLFKMSQRTMRKMRRHIQIVFQDPYGSLNPRMTVGAMVREPLTVHKLMPKRARRDRVFELLELVGLEPDSYGRYPHEFSGGQRQRIGLARALAVEPKLIIADEPVSALDVSIQAQVLNLLVDLQNTLGIAYLFIAHDLSVVRHVSHAVAVMYLGRLVERAPVDELFAQPLHPYTRALMSAVPVPDPQAQHDRQRLEGDVPSPIAPPPGCHFHPRCPEVFQPCPHIDPPLIEHSPDHLVACHLYPAHH
jgi:oligopeptide/dipeptide ABC transporter ATP-binding protein